MKCTFIQRIYDATESLIHDVKPCREPICSFQTTANYIYFTTVCVKSKQYS